MTHERGPLGRFGLYASLATALGIVLSGPAALVIVAHPAQTMPFALGLVLVCGCVGLVVATSRRLAPRAPLVLALTSAAGWYGASLAGTTRATRTSCVRSVGPG